MHRLEIKEAGQITGMGFIGSDIGFHKITNKKRTHGSIRFTINNKGITSQDISITLYGSNITVINNNTNTIIGHSSINFTFDSESLGDFIEITVTGDVISCEYTIPNVNGIQITDMKNLTTIRLVGDSNMQQAASLTSFKLSGGNSITNMTNMFWRCDKLQVIEIEAFNVTTTSGTFYSCRALKFAPLFDTSSVTDMGNMFSYCSEFNTIPLYDTTNVKNMYGMFRGCRQLKIIPPLDTSNVSNMYHTFSDCKMLSELPELDVRSVTNFLNIFSTSPEVTNIKLKNVCSNLDFSVNPNLNYESICYILDNAQTVIGKTINITGCDGYNSLRSDDPSVINAINKGWTIMPTLTSLSLLQGTTAPIYVSPKWVRMRGDGGIFAEDDHFIIKNDGTSDWVKWYYPLPANVTKVRVTLKACVYEITTSPEAILSLSKGTAYDDSYLIYNTKNQSGWIDISREILLTTPYLGFLLRGLNYAAGERYGFKIKDLVVEKIDD